MSFELRDRDLMGRIGRLKTKSGYLETPAFMPVINPVLQTITPKRMKKEFGCDIVITNSYIIRNHFSEIPDLKVHDLLDYDGIIMTDSGAYQILVYGGVKVSQKDIIDFQKQISSDISVILDIPTGWDIPRTQVEYTVEETLKRATDALPLIEESESLWVGPVQGGKHLDLVANSAQRIGEMPYDLHALGSPTEIMERYMYPVLVDMTMTAKLNLPIERPFHLFGAGHPMIFAMTVAMGCDLFDSAAYILFAKDMRYMTTRGTVQLKDLQYLPCSCPVCRNTSVEDIKELPRGERIITLGEHNLHITMTEIETIKQAIVEGNLWDLVETRAKAHPQMTAALKTLSQYSKHMEKNSPGFKGKGVFYYDYNSLAKPEVTRHTQQLVENYRQPTGKDTLLLLSRPPTRPFTGFHGFKKLRKTLNEKLGSVHICFYTAPYGIVPEHLSDTYPLSQFEIATPLDYETIQHTIDQIKQYIKSTKHNKIILLRENDKLGESLEAMLTEEKMAPIVIKSDAIWSVEAAADLLALL